MYYVYCQIEKHLQKSKEQNNLFPLDQYNCLLHLQKSSIENALQTFACFSFKNDTEAFHFTDISHTDQSKSQALYFHCI